MLVLDEVDRMLDMGFKPAIKRIAGVLSSDRQTLCYSATLSPAISEVAALYLKNPVRVEISSELKPSPNVKLQTFEVPTDKKQELLEHLLETNNGSFMVFVRTKHGADRVSSRLSRAGFAAAPIHGDRSQSQRSSALRGFAEGRHRVLVATDVVARGIDVADVAHVVNYDMPREAEDFVHRVGRTGRASSHGVASTFAAPDEAKALRNMERTLSIAPTKYRVHAMLAGSGPRIENAPESSVAVATKPARPCPTLPPFAPFPSLRQAKKLARRKASCPPLQRITSPNTAGRLTPSLPAFFAHSDFQISPKT